MKQYETLTRFERDGFEVVVSKAQEDIDVRGQFDDMFDINEICRKIDEGKLDWFTLRVQVMLDEHEMGVAYLGGCLYEDAREVLTDGVVDDLLAEALTEAKALARKIAQTL